MTHGVIPVMPVVTATTASYAGRAEGAIAVLHPCHAGRIRGKVERIESKPLTPATARTPTPPARRV